MIQWFYQEKRYGNVRKQIGMVFQNPDNQFVGTTVQDDVVFWLREYRNAKRQ